MTLSVAADSIKFIGQDHRTLAMIYNTDTTSYTMKETDPYARIIAYFPQGEVIYSNPFARYDSTIADNPFRKDTHHINYTLTVLFNLMLIAFLVILFVSFYKLMKHK